MPNLPPEYAWLANEAGPKMVLEWLKIFSVHEAPGAGDNPIILAWAKEVGISDYMHDSDAWCGLAMAVVAKRAGKMIPAKPLWALNWVNFGRQLEPGESAGLGDALIFNRYDAAGKLIGGHVGTYIAEDDGAFHVMGGNTKDAVGIARIAFGRLHAVRRPVYQVQPVNVRVIRVGATGELSTNEA